MAVITKIEVQKNNKDRFSIFLDGVFAFGVHADVLVSHNLSKGQELDEPQIEALQYDEMVKKAVLSGIRHISYKPRTCREVADKLRGLEHTEDQIEDALEKLGDMGFLNDLRYAQDYVETRQKRYGKKRILLDLKRRGIAESVAETALDEGLDQDQGYEIAMEMARKKFAQCEGLEPAKAASRIQGMLLRKGYCYEIVRSVIKELGVFER